jgi:hypothetical protein
MRQLGHLFGFACLNMLLGRIGVRPVKEHPFRGAHTFADNLWGRVERGSRGCNGAVGASSPGCIHVQTETAVSNCCLVMPGWSVSGWSVSSGKISV